MPDEDLHPCTSTACRRLVSRGTLYCCAPCAVADEGKYEIDAHSEGCDSRAYRRPTTEKAHA